MTATVTHVIDGDTLQVNTPTGPERVRISQIDAPERSQPYGIEATQCLVNLVQNQPIAMCREGVDRFGRTIASVANAAGHIGNALVTQGCAWAYMPYVAAGSALPQVQASAQAAARGLWSLPAPGQPWQYRPALGPVPAVNGVSVVSSAGPTTAAVHDRIFDWVEHKFPEHAVGGNGTTFNGTAFSRCYAGNLCIRIDGGRLQLVSPDGGITDFGFHGDFLPLVESEGF